MEEEKALFAEIAKDLSIEEKKSGSPSCDDSIHDSLKILSSSTVEDHELHRYSTLGALPSLIPICLDLSLSGPVGLTWSNALDLGFETGDLRH
ncbi:hypothetical protein NL676_038689 [Syzygium grande]|nr:hypothetical protein NL676_038689 [Syzygium grande]